MAKKPKPSVPVQPLLNNEYDCTVYRSDIINMIPNQKFRIEVVLEECKYDGIITPTITLPQKKGFLSYQSQLFNYMLSTCNSIQTPRIEIVAMSELGCIDISYHCKVHDYRDVPYWGSSKIMRPLGMKKEIITPTKNRYYCTNMETGMFDSYQFTIEWTELDI